MLNLDKEANRLKLLKYHCSHCERCAATDPVHKFESGEVDWSQKIWGRGNHKADVMFVGKAPGEGEQQKDIPFEGEEGRVLAQAIERAGGKVEQVYIATVLKCRPPNDREPLDLEISRCVPWLQEQVNIIRPKVIVTLGNIATQALTGTPLGITQIHGQPSLTSLWWNKDSGTICYLDKVWMVPAYHPSYILHRKRDPVSMAEFVQDLKGAFHLAGLEREKNATV